MPKRQASLDFRRLPILVLYEKVVQTVLLHLTYDLAARCNIDATPDGTKEGSFWFAAAADLLPLTRQVSPAAVSGQLLHAHAFQSFFKTAAAIFLFYLTG